MLLPDLDLRGKVDHVCNVVFFTPGHYKMDIQCLTPENTAADNPFSSVGHVWKFIPAIEVFVN